jgi:hypothetical protein
MREDEAQMSADFERSAPDNDIFAAGEVRTACEQVVDFALMPGGFAEARRGSEYSEGGNGWWVHSQFTVDDIGQRFRN